MTHYEVDELQERDVRPSDKQVLVDALMREVRSLDADSPEDRSMLLTRLGMSAEQLSSTIGVPVSTIHSYMAGKNAGPLFEGQLRRATAIGKKLERG